MPEAVPPQQDVVSLEERARFHAPHLERVSRSFAYGISRLSLSLRVSVGLGYLLCRLLDTVEDAQWSSGLGQLHAFNDFETFMTTTPFTASDLADVGAWAARFPGNISEGERLLLTDAGLVFKEFASLSLVERASYLEPVLSMSRGMTYFTHEDTRHRLHHPERLKLTTLEEVNLYCFFVAGVVGELLTGLFQREGENGANESVWTLGTHFGLFLQKVNVLKDQWSDETEGRFLVPSRNVLIKSLRENASGAFGYLQSLPLGRKDYRLFCAWALFLGLATIPLLQASKASGDPAKLSRLKALALGAKIESSILDNTKLETLFSELAETAWPSEIASRVDSREDLVMTSSAQTLLVLRQCYKGRLNVVELARLLARS